MLTRLPRRRCTARHLRLFAVGLLVACADSGTGPGTDHADHLIEGVVTADGDPVRGAGIRIVGPVSNLTRTDLAGHFDFERLPSGRYTVDLFDVPAGVSFAVTEARVSVSFLNRDAEAAFSGEADGHASVLVEVRVGNSGWGGMAVSLEGPATRSAVTDPEGKALFQFLPPGTYAATLEHGVQGHVFPAGTSVTVDAVDRQPAEVSFVAEPAPEPPPVLRSFRAERVSRGTAEIRWSDPSLGPSQAAATGDVAYEGGPSSTYFIERRPAGGEDWAIRTDLPSGSELFIDRGLDPESGYEYQARSCNAGGCSPPTPVVAVTVYYPGPEPPSTLSATPIGATTIALEWVDQSTDETFFRIERMLGAGGLWRTLKSVPGNSTAYEDLFEIPVSLVHYRVRACHVLACSAPSNEVSVITPGAPPAPPLNLVGFMQGGSRVVLGWTDVAEDETGFEVERRVRPGGDWAPLTTLPADLQSFEDHALESHTSYEYRARACNASGCSVFSNVVAVATGDVPPRVPADLSANALGETAISVIWSDVSADESEFVIERAVGGAAWDQLAIKPANSTSHMDQGLTPGTEYSYRVRACSPTLCSMYSPVSRATTPGEAPPLNLKIEAAYLVQRTQRVEGDVPLVKDLGAYVRVFATSNLPTIYKPDIRVRFYRYGSLVHIQMIPAGSGATPQSLDQSNVLTSWNARVDASLIQPGLSILADVDPGGLVSETDESDNQFPLDGDPQALDVRDTPPFLVTFVPVNHTVTGLTGEFTLQMIDPMMREMRRMFPVAEDAADIREVFVTNQPRLERDDGNGAWPGLLSELNALRILEGSHRHYYGVVHLTYSIGVSGTATLGGKAAVGTDRLPIAADVAAHEWGHNAGRRHTPGCATEDPDLSYPYPDGKIGQWGIDLETLRLKSPAISHDLMTYCDNAWVSDYVYEGMMDHLIARGAPPGGAAGLGAGRAAGRAGGWVAGAAPAPAERSLLVWGRIEEGEIVLEPAFLVDAPASVPAMGGRYTMEALDEDGGTLFSLPFEPEPVADGRDGDAVFAFTIPVSTFDEERVAELRVRGGGVSTSAFAVGGAGSGGAAGGVSGTAPSGAQATLASGPDGARVVRWDATRWPMALVRDADSGRVLGFGRGGEFVLGREVELGSAGAAVEITLSDGVVSVEGVVRR